MERSGYDRDPAECPSVRTMRPLLSLAGLLIVLLIVFGLVNRRVASLPAATGAASGVPPAQQAQQVADDIRKAMEEGAAQRASEASQ